ncbi:hypothetical protein AB0J72_52185 [Dactylosporangium sp. NPDC049742]|uniref:hypothetical protein n=1 Tax=Dactylosporangium sp. NPDC049742 TaxID=3154737 RepID=UPI003413DE53
MNIKCGVNGEARDDHQIFVCHHCGMPVCEEHGWVVPADDAFAEFSHVLSVLPDVPPPATGLTLPRPAMHCRDCVDRFHKGTVKRHGWADPRPVGRP